ncbi:O-methyltransferase/demethyldecarbamoylnovobiocin O-methyltransferase [Mariprofundus ferrinatatus]|uniref:O-methyltransferase/demethyldecarbamoylnovobiocin O-methyltransferase n=1 Tax=Mariprofundus ferrinatatus TaxID=1921087 RepID=A0A2K8L264_9PROT|nr:TylF/MycF family methyltransferase [Mariprofundus ferrinatatus]ATX81420.1 O-methyltransferase/demethyldecarbamoylnovobiocin O-methyltransferase [Mariprofundus ferrinatatus]
MNHPSNKSSSDMRNEYLDLMLKCLTGSIYHDAPTKLNSIVEYDDELREYGWDWPTVAHSMIGRKRMRNVRDLVESIIGNKVKGDLIETGVWRGGACIMMRAVLKAYGVTDRTVWLADSFEGLPKPNVEDYPADAGETFHEYEELSVSIDRVQENFRRYGLLDEQVKFIKGWFKDTLPGAPIDKLALIRLDGDLYESTIQPLDALYDKLSVGGYVIVDDYHVVKGCKAAIHDFFKKRDINPQLVEIDGVGVYWKKEQ